MDKESDSLKTRKTGEKGDGNLGNSIGIMPVVS